MKRTAFLVLLAAAGANAQTAPIYGLVNGSNAQGEFYHFGYFDLEGGTGSPGSQSFAWTNLSTSGAGDDWTNVAKNPANGQLYLQTNFSEFRTISNTGVLGPVLGTSDAYFGMTFAADGNLYALNPYVASSANLVTINPATGIAISNGPAGFDGYSQMGGGLTAVGNDLYFTGVNLDNFLDGELQRVGTGTVATLSGPGFNWSDYLTVGFSWNNVLYLINEDRLYSVNTTNGNLTTLGTVTNLPALEPANRRGFSGAVGNVIAPVPEPSTYGLVLGAGALALAAARRRRKSA